MAKMFYTIEEAAAKMGVSVDKVKEMSTSGQLQEFRDRDKLVFKREQVDLLASPGDEESPIPLADSGELSLASDDSGSGSGAVSSPGDTGTKERSGISIFEPDETEDSDPSAQTQVTASVGGMAVADPGASGSGMLDLTHGSADDTGLGAQLEGVYSGPQGAGGDSGDQAALFEPAGVASDTGAAAAPVGVMVAAEPYDGTWSGIAGGLAFAMVVILGVMLVVTLMGILGVNGFGLTTALSTHFAPALGGMAALAVVCALVGWAIGRKS